MQYGKICWARISHFNKLQSDRNIKIKLGAAMLLKMVHQFNYKRTESVNRTAWLGVDTAIRSWSKTIDTVYLFPFQQQHISRKRRRWHGIYSWTNCNGNLHGQTGETCIETNNIRFPLTVGYILMIYFWSLWRKYINNKR